MIIPPPHPGARAAFESLPLGTRVVVRYRIAGGATDALGEIARMTDVECEISTRRGDVTIVLSDIIAAKKVPSPPVRRQGPRTG